MKSNFFHLCFIIDKSGSMYQSVNDVIGGFKKIVDDQKAIKEGTCAVSLFTFNDVVNKDYLGVDINEIKDLEYSPRGLTAMNDGIGTAIDEVGVWLSNMPEEERPEQNLIVIMTDGEENSSKEYSLSKVKEMIKHQESKYNWKFMYVGTDITSKKDAENLGIGIKTYSTRKNFGNSYTIVSSAMSNYRMSSESIATKLGKLSEELCAESDKLTENTEKELGRKID